MLRISFTLPRPTGVRIDIVDTIGRIVASPWDAALGPGDVDLSWDGRGLNGHGVVAGVYWVRLSAGQETRASQLVWLR